MKWLGKNTVSFFDRRFRDVRLQAHKTSPTALVVGYSGLSESDSRVEFNGAVGCELTAILCAGVAKASRSAREDEICAIEQLLEVKAKFRSYVGATMGKMIFITDDHVLAKFKDVDSAVRCAVNLKVALSKLNACRSAAQRVRYRISINVCEADMQWFGIAGRESNVAPRSGISTYPAGIYISRLARERLRDKSRIRFISLGTRYLPNHNAPVEAFWIELDRTQLFDVDESRGGNVLAEIS